MLQADESNLDACLRGSDERYRFRRCARTVAVLEVAAGTKALLLYADLAADMVHKVGLDPGRMG